MNRDRQPRADARGGLRGARGVEVPRAELRAPAGDREQRDVDAARDPRHLVEEVGVAGEVHRALSAHDVAERLAAGTERVAAASARYSRG